MQLQSNTVSPGKTLVDKTARVHQMIKGPTGVIEYNSEGREGRFMYLRPFVKGGQEPSQHQMFVYSRKQSHPKGPDHERSRVPRGQRELRMLEHQNSGIGLLNIDWYLLRTPQSSWQMRSQWWQIQQARECTYPGD